MWVRRHQSMSLLSVLPEGIWMEEGPWVGSTSQPDTQMGPVHMGTNGHRRGEQSFTAPLNLALADPLEAPTFRQMGVMLVGMATSKAWEMVKEGTSCACMAPLAMGAEDSGSTFWGSWGVGLDTVVAGALGRRLGHWHRGMRKDTLQEPVQAFCLRSGHHHLHFLEACSL